MIGAGHMGGTYARGISKSPLLDGHKVQIFDKDKEKIKRLKEEAFFEAFYNLEDCLPKADIVFIGVKPQHCHGLFDEMKPMINNSQLFISIMAGVKIKTIIEGLGVDKVVRTMPNLPAKIGLGVTAFTESKSVTRLELLLVRNFLSMTGKSIHVENEDFTDRATAISGSGPGYIFYFMQSMFEAAREFGFSEKDANTLVASTFEGAVKIFQESNISFNEWMDRVASKGGTTAAGLNSLADNNVKELIKEAAKAANNRAIELGKE